MYYYFHYNYYYQSHQETGDLFMYYAIVYITSFNLQNNLHPNYLFGFIFKAEKIKAQRR